MTIGHGRPEIIETARLEKCLNRMAEIIVQFGDAGEVYLPIYQRLENELQARHTAENQLNAVRARAELSRAS